MLGRRRHAESRPRSLSCGNHRSIDAAFDCAEEDAACKGQSGMPGTVNLTAMWLSGPIHPTCHLFLWLELQRQTPHWTVRSTSSALSPRTAIRHNACMWPSATQTPRPYVECQPHSALHHISAMSVPLYQEVGWHGYGACMNQPGLRRWTANRFPGLNTPPGAAGWPAMQQTNERLVPSKRVETAKF